MATLIPLGIDLDTGMERQLAQGDLLETFNAHVVLPNNLPVLPNEVGFHNQILKINDGVNVREYSPIDNIAPSIITSGDISIGTSNDGSFVDIAGANATFNIGFTGTYELRCAFSYSVAASLGLSLQTETWFRLRDDTSPTPINSPVITSGNSIPGLLAFTIIFKENIIIYGEFNLSAGSHTFTLQKRNMSSSGLNTRQILANTNTQLVFKIRRIGN